MSVGARRFHEAGLGSRTGLRIGSIRLDEQGNEDLDAFFAESKRVLEWMDASEDEEAGDTGAGENDDAVSTSSWERSASRLSEWAAHSLGRVPPSSPHAPPVPPVPPVSARPAQLPARASMAPRADESMWNSTVDISRAERTFQLSTMPGDVSPQASSASRSPHWLESEASAGSVPDAGPSTSTPMSRPGMSTPLVRMRDTSLASVRADLSRVPETDMPSFLRPDASVLSRRERDVDAVPSVHESRTYDAEPVYEPLDAYDADVGADAEWDAGAGAGAGLSDVDEDKDEEEEQVEVAPKRGRGRPRKDAMGPPRGRPGRPPGRQKPAQRIVERIYDPPMWQLENPQGLRRGKRHRIAPLDWWRGERALYGKPEDAADEDDAPAGVVAPVLKKVIRVPRAPGEGTFSGMRRFRAKPAGYAQPGRPPGSRNFVPRLTPVSESGDEDSETVAEAEVNGSMIRHGRVRQPEEGWDADTDPYGRVMDADANAEVTMRIACTAAGIRPRPAFNQQFLYEKIFGVSDFMAAGVLVIPRGGEKPTKPSKDNNYTFVVLEGAVQVMVHRTRFVIAPGGMFLVPRQNTYCIKNVAQREARIFFAQARNLNGMTSVVHEGRTAFAHGTEHVTAEAAAPADTAEAWRPRGAERRRGAYDEAAYDDAGPESGASDSDASDSDTSVSSASVDASGDYDISRDLRYG